MKQTMKQNQQTPSSSSEAVHSSAAAAASSISTADDLIARDSAAAVTYAETIVVERRGEFAAVCRWTVNGFSKTKAKALWSKYFEVGGYDCRLLVYPKGDSQALPGYVSVYLQIMDPRGTSSWKWDCFASYQLTIVNGLDDSKSVKRDSWHRFSSKKKSHGWCDFTPSLAVSDPKMGYLFNTDSVLITADILILNESVSFVRDNSNSGCNSNDVVSGAGMLPPLVVGAVPDVLSGKFTWKVHNFSLFKGMIKTQKIMSPLFPSGECKLRISVYQSTVNGVDYLSMCLESKDSEKVAMLADRSCWCLFRISALNQKPGLSHMHKDSYGRFASDNKGGDSTSLGWNDYMRISDFLEPESGFLVDDTAVFSTSFHVIKEFSSFSKNGGNVGGRSGAKKMDGHMGKLTWRIENFTRLKDILKKRKITGLCIKSKRFQIGNRDCRLIVYPRGQSQPPCYLSVFLEVTDSRNTSSDWSCFVSHRLSVMNQKTEEKSVSKESQNRYSKVAKDWGWREFVTLTSLFDQDSGFLVQDTVVFTAEVLILKETSTVQEFTVKDNELTSASCSVDVATKESSFTWKVENFSAFKEIIETRKIFSKFFQAGGCELRIGVYESVDTICLYLESDQSGSDPDMNFWVKYRMAVINQKNPTKNVWKESSICTKTWNNSVLQFIKVSDMMEADAGFLVRDSVVFVCEVLDCCPWFDFSDLEVLVSEDDQDALTDPDELIDSDESEGVGGEEEDIFRNLLSRAGFHLTCGDNSAQPQVTLREQLLMDAGAIAHFLTGLRVYLDDPAKVKLLLLPTKLSGNASPCLMNLLMGVKVLQQAIIDILLDIMVECCQSSEESCSSSSLDASPKSSLDGACAASPLRSDRYNNATACAQVHTRERLDTGMGETLYISAVQSSDVSEISVPPKATRGQPSCPPETSACGAVENPTIHPKTKWPEQSEELLGLIVNSLRALDGAVPQGCPEPRRRPQSAQKIGLVLDKAPKHLMSDLIALVPKLVERAEHPLAAYSLIERLKADAEPALRTPVFDALGQLECSSEVWEQVLLKSFELLPDINDEPLAETIDFLLKAASHCQHLPLAVRAIRVRLKSLGADVAPCVLEYLGKIVNTWGDVAETILEDINCDEDFGEMLIEMGEQAFSTSYHFSDICIVIEILSIPCLAAEASQTFERAVSKGAFLAQSVDMVLERRFAHTQNLNSRSAENLEHPDAGIEREASDHLRAQQDEFTSLLSLAEMLTLSSDPCVRSFVKALYTILSKWYMDESHREKMLKRLIDRAVSTTDNNHEIDVDFEILVSLVSEDQEIVRPVFSLMREVAELANVDRAALWHQLCANEEEIIRMREESEFEISSLEGEKAALSQKLSESEASNSRVKSELRADMDNFAREKKDLSEHIQEVGSQLEWIRAERGDEVAKLAAERKVLQDRLHDAENQLSQLKSRKRDELKKVTMEKNALAERLKSAEAARKRFDEDLKRYATENMTREEIRKSLEDEVQRLTETVGQTDGEKREKEEQVARCEAYIDGMEPKLEAYKQYIRILEVSLQEEMSKHAPLYGAGLEALSMNELATLACIHEDGLRQIHALQQRKGNSAVSPLMNPHILPHNHGLYPTSTSPMTIGLPSPLIPSGVGVHSNGNVNGAIGPWFKHT